MVSTDWLSVTDQSGIWILGTISCSLLHQTPSLYKCLIKNNLAIIAKMCNKDIWTRNVSQCD